MRFKFLLLIFAIFFSGTIVAQRAQWGHSIASEGYDESLDLCTDQNGNVYIAGQIEFLAQFDDGYALESAGIHDIFLAKYDSLGMRIWAKRAGARFGGEKAHSIAVDPMGNVYLAGEIDDTSYFDTIQVIGRPANNTFIAKYDANGNALWVRHFETDSMNTRGYSIAVDNSGNIYATGATQGNAYYNGTLLLGTTGDYDAFVFKFDTYGNFNWIKQIGGGDSDKAYGIATDGQNVFVTGYFAGVCQFDPGTTLTGYGGTDFFLAKYDNAGNFQWAKQGGDTSFDRGWDVTINTNGDVVCVGEFAAHAHFDGQTIYANGLMDMFIAVYDQNGNVKWIAKGGGPEDDIGRNVAHDNNGNLYVGGDYADHATFPPYNITSNGFSDVFFVSYDINGNTRFVNSYGGALFDRGRGVGVDAAGNMYFSGEFNDEIEFDNIHLVGDTNSDIFIIQMKMVPTCAVSVSATGSISCNGICDGSASANANGQSPFEFEWSTNPPQQGMSVANLCPGTYLVTVTDGQGCQNTTSVTLIDPPALVISSAIIDNASCTGCTDGSIQVNVTGGTAPYAFQWSDGDQNQNRSNLAAGAYSLCITDDHQCATCDSFFISEPPAGINESNNTLFSVFPNPVNEITKVEFSQYLTQGDYNLQLYSSIGQKLMEMPVNSQSQIISLGNYSKGVYFLKIQNKNTNIIEYSVSLIRQ